MEDKLVRWRHWLSGHEFEQAWCPAVCGVAKSWTQLSGWTTTTKILIPACNSSILACHMMYSAYKLNEQGDITQPWCTPFPILKQSIVPCSNCCLLTCIPVSQKADKVVWYFHLFKNFPVCGDPHSQRSYHSQWHRSGIFSGILLLSLWSNEH